jgi:hypothetical protein
MLNLRVRCLIVMCMYRDDKKDYQSQPCLENIFIIEGHACLKLFTSNYQAQAKKYMYSKITESHVQ